MENVIKYIETDKGMAVFDYQTLANKPDIESIEHEFVVDLVSSFTDTVSKGADYKGYLDGKGRVDISLPSGTVFEVLLETEAFTMADLYYSTNGTSFGSLKADVPANERIKLTSGNDIVSITIFAKAANVNVGGEFTVKVILPNKDGIEYQVSHLLVGDAGDGILNLNPRDEMLPLIMSAKTTSGLGNASARSTCLMIAHFSDIHADVVNMKRVVEFCDEYDSYVDVIICTGDMARDNAVSGGERAEEMGFSPSSETMTPMS